MFLTIIISALISCFVVFLHHGYMVSEYDLHRTKDLANMPADDDDDDVADDTDETR